MRYYLIAGEASGDLHASNLMVALKKEDESADFRFFGGDLMKAAGGTLVKHYREMAFMGIIPVLLHARTILRNMKICREDIRVYQPDVVILIDYPGFNLKMAKFVKKQLKIPVYYYIAPKIWAWKKYRIKSIRRYVDRMFCILPFEVDFFKSLHYQVDYVGNPSVDSVAVYREDEADEPDDFFKTNGLPQKPVLAILAGSRKAEIKQNLPAMLAVAKEFPDYQCVIAGAPGSKPDDYNRALQGKKVAILYGQTYPILAHASFALVTSGTATLETALFRVPQVVCYYYAGGKIVNFVFKNFFHTPYISLVNLIAGKEVVKELFGANFSRKNIREELSRMMNDKAYRNKMLEGYDCVISIIGKPGASKRTAQLIVQFLYDISNSIMSRAIVVQESQIKNANHLIY